MNQAAWAKPRKGGLPPLSGGSLWFYRSAAAFLAIAVCYVLFSSFANAEAHPAITGLRLAKGAILLGVAGILSWRRQRDPVAALLSLAFLTWAITSGVDFTSTDLLPVVLDRVRFLLFALALLLFPDGDWQPRWTRQVAIASAAVFVVGLLEAIGLLPTRAYLPAAIACILAAITALTASFRAAADQSVRQQLKWVGLGLTAGVGLILGARGGAQVLPKPVLWEAMFQSGIVLVALGFLISLLRFRLYDAETAISRSAVLASLTLVLVATFAATEAAVEWIGQQYVVTGIGNVSAAMAAAVAAVLLNPLHERIRAWAEVQFQRDLVALKRDLPDLLADLVASANLAELVAAVLPRINAGVHSTWSALTVGDALIGAVGIDCTRARNAMRGSAEEPDGAVTVIPLNCPFSGRASTLILGPRPDGSRLGADDLEALQSLRIQLRHALSWIIQRELAQLSAVERDSALSQRFALLQQRIEALESRVAGRCGRERLDVE